MLLSTLVDFSSGLNYWLPDVKKVAYLNQGLSLDGLASNRGLFTKTATAIERSKQVNAEGARSRDGFSGQKACESSIDFGQGDLVEIKATLVENLTSTPAIVLRFYRDSPNPT